MSVQFVLRAMPAQPRFLINSTTDTAVGASIAYDRTQSEKMTSTGVNQ